MDIKCDFWNIISALGTIGTFIIAGFVFYFERKRQLKDKPHITIWINCKDQGGQITLFNSGLAALPVKVLDVPSDGRLIHSLFFSGASIPGGAKLSIENLVLEQNKIYPVLLHCEGGSPGQFQLRFQLFDGSFKFVSIDPSFWGPYNLHFADGRGWLRFFTSN